jgi:hypothetical protein
VITLTGPYPPVIAHIGDRTWAISGPEWKEVPHTTQLSDLAWARKEVRHTFGIKLRFPFHGKTGTYEIRLTDGVWTCDCPGFFYRKHCSHLDHVRSTIKL